MHIIDSSITVEGLRVRANHGVMPQERAVGNDFVVSATLRYDATLAAHSDEIAEALNYAEVIETIKSEMAVPSRLIEHAAGRIAAALLHDFPIITGGTVTVSKPHPPVRAQLAAASVTIAFSR